MFVMGGHPQIDLGRTRYCFNPKVLDMSKEMVMMKEGCLSFPFIFVAIKRPKWIEVQYTDEEGEIKKEHMHGMNSRIFQHENEHMNGLIFKDLVSDFKWKRAESQAKKQIEKLLKKQTKH
jgi:peptide deformylase